MHGKIIRIYVFVVDRLKAEVELPLLSGHDS